MLSHITLHLARSPVFPEGSVRHGYEIVAPLDADGYLDPAAWHRNRARCAVRRFWAGQPDRRGWLRHRPGGVRGATWVIDYNAETEDDDEVGYRLEAKSFAPGEYVTITDADGPDTFRVVAVDERAAA